MDDIEGAENLADAPPADSHDEPGTLDTATDATAGGDDNRTGEGSQVGNESADGERERFIPRERFDAVYEENAKLRAFAPIIEQLKEQGYDSADAYYQAQVEKAEKARLDQYFKDFEDNLYQEDHLTDEDRDRLVDAERRRVQAEIEAAEKDKVIQSFVQQNITAQVAQTRDVLQQAGVTMSPRLEQILASSAPEIITQVREELSGIVQQIAPAAVEAYLSTKADDMKKVGVVPETAGDGTPPASKPLTMEQVQNMSYAQLWGYTGTQ